MDVKVLYKSLHDYDPDLNIENIDDEMLIISPNEYLTLFAAEANEMMILNNSDIHWHMET